MLNMCGSSFTYTVYLYMLNSLTLLKLCQTLCEVQLLHLIMHNKPLGPTCDMNFERTTSADSKHICSQVKHGLDAEQERKQIQTN